jgi:hypothetical protein
MRSEICETANIRGLWLEYGPGGLCPTSKPITEIETKVRPQPLPPVLLRNDSV